MSGKVIAYTAGVFDLFHIGHVNLLRNAKSVCDYLIVAVSTDEHVKNYKNKTPVIPYEHRVEVVKSCKYADAIVPQDNGDRMDAWRKLKFDIMIVGDDWYGTEKWHEYERQLKEVGVRIIYFPYTKNISSTMINKILEEKRQELDKKEKDVEDFKKNLDESVLKKENY